MAYTLDQLQKMGATPVERPSSAGGYTLDQLKSMGAQPVATPAKPTEEPKREDGLLASIVKAPIESLLVKPAARFAEALGRTGAFGGTIKRGYEAMADEGQDIGGFKVEAVKPGFAGVKQIAGETAEAASYLPIGAGVAAVGKTALGTAAKTTALQAAETGAKMGGISGGLYGGGTALQDDEDVAGVATRALTGSLTGAAFGGIAGGAFQAAGNKARDVMAKRAETRALLEGGVPDARVATKSLTETGKVVTDKAATEAVRQGIPEADVALIRVSSAADKTKMAKMLDVRQSQLTNKRVTDRATDVVGDTFVERLAKPIEKLNREAGAQLNVVARKLGGSKVDTTPAINQFSDNLQLAGVKIGKNGTLNFKDSNYEGLTGAQKLINNVWMRALKVAKTGDAYKLHQVKSYIDEIVNYGKQAEGLSGKAQTMLKQFRHEIDAILDGKFSSYNEVNTQFADTIRQLNDMGAAIGRTFKLGDTFADARAGLAMRRILSNTQSRAEILKLLDNMQKVAKKYGIEIDEDIITQANFADVLERMFGTEAPTSLLGQTERALSAGTDIARGNIISGTIKAGKYAFDVTRGVSAENRMDALRELLRVVNKGTVFGRK